MLEGLAIIQICFRSRLATQSPKKSSVFQLQSNCVDILITDARTVLTQSIIRLGRCGAWRRRASIFRMLRERPEEVFIQCSPPRPLPISSARSSVANSLRTKDCPKVREIDARKFFFSSRESSRTSLWVERGDDDILWAQVARHCRAICEPTSPAPPVSIPFCQWVIELFGIG